MIMVREAVEKDWPSISHISGISGYVDYINRVGQSYMKWGTVLLAEDRGEPLGFLLLQFLQDRSGWLSGIRVDPDHRRKGVAKTLTERAVRMCLGNGINEVRMLVHVDNGPSIALAKSMGFGVMQTLTFYEGDVDISNSEESETVPMEPVFYDWKVMVPSSKRDLPGKVYKKGNSVLHLSDNGGEKYYHIYRGEEIECIEGNGTISHPVGACAVKGIRKDDYFPDAHIFRKILLE